MCKMYDRIKELCSEKNISISQMCREVGISNSLLTELKSGRTKQLSTDKSIKIADFFNVSVQYLAGETNQRNTESVATNDDIKFALFGGDGEITDEMLDEVKSFAQFIKNKYKKE